MDPRLGTDTSGPGEAVFAIRFNGKPQILQKNLKFSTRKKFEKKIVQNILAFLHFLQLPYEKILELLSQVITKTYTRL